MEHFDKKDVIQAILIADNNVDNFKPLSDDDSTVSIECCQFNQIIEFINGGDSSITGTHSFGKCFHVGLCPGGIKSQWYRGGFCLCQFTFTKCTRSHQVSVATTGVIVVVVPVLFALCIS